MLTMGHVDCWSGPEFLQHSQEHWPHCDVGDIVEDDKEAITLKASQNALTAATGVKILESESMPERGPKFKMAG